MKCLLWIPAICMVVSSVSADTVIFKDGSTLEGVVVRDMEFKVEVKRYMGAGVVVTEYSPDEIDEIIMDEKANQRILDQHKTDVEAQEHEATVGEEGVVSAGEKTVIDIKKEVREQRRQERQRKKEAEQAAARRERRKAEKEVREIERLERKLQKQDEQKFEMERESLRFGQIQERVNPSGWHIYKGTVYNDGKYTKDNVLVIMDFYDRKGDLLLSKNVYVDPGSIEPGEKSSFTVMVMSPSAFIAKYETTAAWDFSVDEPSE